MQFVTLITDCDSPNDFGRQVTRLSCFFEKTSIIPVSIKFGGTLEASGNLLDILNASEGKKGVILVNAAPRHGEAKKWPNGTPFGYFFYKETLIISTIDGYCLSLAKKLGLIDYVRLTDIPTVLDAMITAGNLPEDQRNLIINSQFRSFEYMPRLAKWISEEIDIPHEKYDVNNIVAIPKVVWLVDGFGNCKTTIFPEEVGHEAKKLMQTKIGDLICYERLKDVPNGEPGLIIGSAGFGQKRLLEVVVQGKSAAQRFNITSGTELF